MLTKCPECDLQVSDKAFNCPHCGYPFVKETRIKKHSKGKYKLPNGFGQITKLNNKNLRKSYRAMVTIGKDSYGKPIQRLLKPQSYFSTYNEAYEALVEYNKDPYDLSNSVMTLRDLYELWYEEYSKKVESQSSLRSIKAAWNKSSLLYDMRINDIKVYHLKKCILENTETSINMKSRLKSVYNLMFDYAVERELCNKNPARAFNLSDSIDTSVVKKEHISFSDTEMEILWSNTDVAYVNIILIQCYSGWRPQELVNIKLEDVDLENWLFKGGMKTKAGKNRVVPIHPKIKNLVTQEYNRSKELGHDKLISCIDGRSGLNMTYDKYNKRFIRIVHELDLNPDHRTHDPRKHFITLAKKYEVDEYAIKYMVGHAITDITENTYTSRETSWLISEISKIQ